MISKDKITSKIKKFFLSIFKFIKVLIVRMNVHDINQRGAELSYYLVVSALAAFVALVYAAHFFTDLITDLSEGIYLLLPPEIADWAMSAIVSVSLPGSLPVMGGTLITIIWFVSRAMHSMMRSFNVIYHTTNRGSVFKMKLFSILFTLALVVLFIVIFFLSVAQQAIGDFLQKHFEYKGFFSESNISVLISLVLMMFVFTMLYFQLPNYKTNILFSLPGAGFTTAVWFGISKVFSYYVNNLSTFSWVLGSLGSIFLFLVWIYWLSIVVLTGAEINHMIIEKINPKKKDRGRLETLAQ